ncbi:MAG TPA: gliding motility-associated C-terminal domain-containing protein, partial [Bacteroidia bacterium]
ANVIEDVKTCYNVTGPFSFCTSVEPEIAGAVVLNTVSYSEEHSDVYFGGVRFTAIAAPNENYYFDHWEPDGFTLPASALVNDSIMWKFDSASCLKAVFKLKEPYNLTGDPSVPTGFSPNGDGNNDVLNVYGTINATEYHMEVYNRWGQKMFESNDKTIGWDGTYKGQEAPIGVYAYTFKVTVDGKQLQKSGSITLIR